MSFVVNIKGNQSHSIVSDALTILENVHHRGASGSEVNSGDGAGILLQIPHEFFVDECIRLGIHLPSSGCYGIGMLFFPKDLRLKEECRDIFARSAEKLGLEILGYRRLPVNPDGIGPTALSIEPDMEQVFIDRPDHITSPNDFERKLFLLRNYAAHTINNTIKKDPVGFYIASLSYRTIVYKGQLTNYQLRGYFPDLSNKRFVSAFGLVHCRFATNTPPSWRLAQPFRYISHKGEITTLEGNVNSIRAGEKAFHSPYFTKEEMDMLLPIILPNQSDSACLDSVVELLTLCGRSLPHVMMMMIPEAWDENDRMDPIRRSFYEFHSAITEPWDGPAAISFTDGTLIGAMPDRIGLRTSRYCITSDDRVILAQETGVLPVDPRLIIETGGLRPGKMFIIDMSQGRVISDDEIKATICSQKPYAEWLNKYKIRLQELPEPTVLYTHLEHDAIFRYQKEFGYTDEDLNNIIGPMAIEGKEPQGSMGADIPLAVLSDQPQHLCNYFKQLFAQVTNPSIDPVRERHALSLSSFVGSGGNLLQEDPLQCHSVMLKHPVLSNHELEKMRSIDTGIFQAKTIQAYFKADGKPGSLREGLNLLCRYAVDAIETGFEVLIISDRDIHSDQAPIPSLLAVAAVHHHLIRNGYRGSAGIVAEAGDVWEVHHFACLLGFGAAAVNPYVALSSIREMKLTERLQTPLDTEQLKKNYISAVCDGLRRILSKMGISTLQSYQGAQAFEIIGLSRSVIDTYFTGAISRIEGLGLDEIAKEVLAKHFFAFSRKDIPVERLPAGGVYQWRRKGEFHLVNPHTIHLLQYAVRMNDYSTFKKYSILINDQGGKAATIRSLFTFLQRRPSIPIEEVEPAEQIYHRFSTAAMSFGSISHEAHSTLAIAMNRLGGKSNCGEGGEDQLRDAPLPNGDSFRSAIRQVASGRFGVTNAYIALADELQIKMAQGSSPGEGGQLPADKADEWVTKVRHTRPGFAQDSPSSHQDVQSMDDLAQLIFDLKNANRAARINVKLASKLGIGSIAAGVVKAKAEALLISGHDGGTGASPWSSILHAGLPWELGLAESHQTLVRQKLRSRVILQVDGQLKTGRDIAISILLGAEEWSIGTAALISVGCVMMKTCHLNTCPVGIATQNPELRQRFTGDPEHVVNLFKFLTQELREIMAQLGFRTVVEMIGQVDGLAARDDIRHWKYGKLDLSPILYKEPASLYTGLHKQEEQDHGLTNILDWRLLDAARPALEKKTKIFAAFTIRNTDRAIGTLLSNEIYKNLGSENVPGDLLHFKFTGTAGQSFGAFASRGLTLELEGDANDYPGKGLSGARIVVYPNLEAGFVPEENVIIGNAAFYGATSGEAFIRGKAGERFCVRNSGAMVVVEGVGDNGCEYMTAGRVVVLGDTGTNFAAGMQGGIAYVYDVRGRFAISCNRNSVDLDPVASTDVAELRDLIQRHYAYTGSTVAKFVLDDFDNQLQHFIKVRPYPHPPSYTEDPKPKPENTKSRTENTKSRTENPTTAFDHRTSRQEEHGRPNSGENSLPLANSESRELLRLKEENQRMALLLQKFENTKNEQDRTYTIVLETRDTIRTAIKQFLIFFSEYTSAAKGQEVSMEIRNTTVGLSIELSDNKNVEQLLHYLQEYIEFALTNVNRQNVNIENEYLSERRKDILILELKNQVHFLQTSIEARNIYPEKEMETLKREIIYLNKEIENLKLQAERYFHLLDKPQLPSNNTYYLQANSNSHASAEAHIDFDFQATVNNLQRDFLNFKEELLKIAPEKEAEINKIDEDLLSVDPKDEKTFKNSSLNRLKRFLDVINDDKSTLGKGVTASKKCLHALQQLGRTYNKFAQWLMWPQIPDIFLNKGSE